MRQYLHGGLAVALASAALASTGVAAESGHHHRYRHHAVQAYRHAAHPHWAYYGGGGEAYEYPGYGYAETPYDRPYVGPGATVFEAARRAALEPGLTTELAPDAKETATGGPSGGVPGFSGR